LIVFVGTQGEQKLPSDRGKLLGVAEIGDKSVKTADVIDLSTSPAAHFDGAQYRWPEGIPMLRAWRFAPPMLTRDVLSASLRPDAQVRAVPLSAEGEAAIRQLNWVEVELPDSDEIRRQRRRQNAFSGKPSKPGDLAPVIPPFMSRICSGYGPVWTGS
jgi:hypothetical protein